jgi:hypothetical protein
MTTRLKWLVRLIALLWITTPALAALKDIHLDKLPQDETIQKAYDEAAAVEVYAQVWTNQWRYEIPKDTVVSQLKDSLEKLQKAVVSAPGNPELLLLTGLVARYAYNVDVEGAHDMAVSSLQKAHQIAPDDVRGEWFLGIHQCQAGLLKEGMDVLVAIESRSRWDRLSPGFWDDYISCAIVANMPAHALRAGDHLSKLNAPPSEYRDSVMEIARKRFITPDLNATYSGKEVWQARNKDSRTVFKSYMCGLSFSSLTEWKLAQIGVQKGLCVVQLETGPHHGKAGEVVPSLVLIVRQPKPGETLAAFMKAFMKYPSPQTVEVSHCPSEKCLATEAVIPKAYGPRGNGHFVVTVFKRDAPEFPGLIFEEPSSPDAPNDGKVHYFRPNERLHRMEGVLYYAVALDTADSVLGDARQDYDTLLKDMQAE